MAFAFLELLNIVLFWIPASLLSTLALQIITIQAHGVEKSKKTYDEEILSEETIAKIQEEALKGNIYGR